MGIGKKWFTSIEGRNYKNRFDIQPSNSQFFTHSNYGKYSSGAAKYIKEIGLPFVKSVLDLYNWTDANFIPGTYELEPVVSDKVYYVEPLIDYSKIKP